MKIINRKSILEFFGVLSESPLLAPLGIHRRESIRELDGSMRLYRGQVRGLVHFEYELIHPLMQKHDRLTLKREPDNQSDHYAIAVWYGSFKLGYLPKGENKLLARLMDAGKLLTAEIRHVAKDSRNTLDGFIVEVRGEVDYLL